MYKFDAMVALEQDPLECMQVMDQVLELLQENKLITQLNELKAIAHNNKGILYVMLNDNGAAISQFAEAHLLYPLLSAPLFNKCLLILAQYEYTQQYNKKAIQQISLLWLKRRGIPIDKTVEFYNGQVNDLIAQLSAMGVQEFTSHIGGKVSREQEMIMDVEMMKLFAKELSQDANFATQVLAYK